MRRTWIGILAAGLLAGAAAADRLEPPQPVRPSVVRAAHPGGVWACPVVKLAGAPGWLHIVNAGGGASSVRISFVPGAGATVERTLTLAAGHAVTIGTPRPLLGADAGAIVDYAGGNVTVSRTVSIGGAAGAASCAHPGGATLVVPQGSTFDAETQLVLMNPGASDAVVDISLLTNGPPLEPQSLSGRVVPAGQRLVVREGDYAFDTRAVVAKVIASAGRVVVDGVFIGRSAADLIPAVPPAREAAAIGSTARGGLLFSIVAIGDADAVGEGGVLSSQGRSTFGPLVTALSPDTPLVSAPPAGPPGAVALEAVSSTSPIAVAARWHLAGRVAQSDDALTSGVAPSHEVVAVLGPPATTSAMRLLIANADSFAATLDITVFSELGLSVAAGKQGVALGPSRTATLTLQGLPPAATVGVAIRSSGGRVVAAIEATPPAPAQGLYAVTAVPLMSEPIVGIEADPRRGVPAA